MTNRALKNPDPNNDQFFADKFAKHNKGKVTEIIDPRAIGQDIFRSFGEFAVRRPDEFTRPLKTKDVGKIRLSYALHLFGKYSIPYHLQTIWFNDLKGLPRFATAAALEELKLTQNARSQMIKKMFITVGIGGSLYKEHTKEFLTKKETHSFLTCPFKLSFEEAIYYALAKAHTNDIGIINRIYKSKLASKDYKNIFWRELVRFFCVNSIPINEMNDLIDYIETQYRADRSYSIKGRTITALKIQTEQWHRALSRAKRMGNASWSGISVPNSEYKDMSCSDNNKQFCDWKMTQLLSSSALAQEGSKMHHCVYSYQIHCISGRTSIWSLSRKNKNECSYERVLTIEVHNETGTVVQIRGYANRLARPYELNVVKQWARENNMSVNNSRW